MLNQLCVSSKNTHELADYSEIKHLKIPYGNAKEF